MDNPHDCIIFLRRDGQPLPECLQGPLERNRRRLAREFPTLNDPATLQNLLDAVGQRVLDKMQRGDRIHGLESFVAKASRNAALDAISGVDVYQRGRIQAFRTETVDPPQSTLEPWWNKALTADEEDLLVRHLWMGDRHDEIAQALHLPVSTVRNRYSRILEKIRTLWKAPKDNGTNRKPCGSIIDPMRKDQSNG